MTRVMDKRRDPRVEPDDAAAEEAPSTARPPFDPTEFARESERLLAAAEAHAPDRGRPTVRAPTSAGRAHPSASELPGDAGSMPELLEGDPGTVAIDALGPGVVPFVVMPPKDVAWFDLPPEVARLLACIDGTSSLGAVCVAADISVDDGASLLLDLAEWGVVGLSLSASRYRDLRRDATTTIPRSSRLRR